MNIIIVGARTQCKPVFFLPVCNSLLLVHTRMMYKNEICVHSPAHAARVLERVDLTLLVTFFLLLFTGLSGSTTATGACLSGAALYHEYTVGRITNLSSFSKS